MTLHPLDVLLVHGRHRALGGSSRGCHDGRRMRVMMVMMILNLFPDAHDAGDQERSSWNTCTAVATWGRVETCRTRQKFIFQFR